MKSIIEYLKLIPKGLKHPQKVIEGWILDAKLENHSLQEDELVEIIRRRDICESCPLMSANTLKDQTEYVRLHNKPYKTERLDNHCTICACPINKLTASLSADCGADEYKGKEEIEIKWKTFKK